MVMTLVLHTSSIGSNPIEVSIYKLLPNGYAIWCNRQTQKTHDLLLYVQFVLLQWYIGLGIYIHRTIA